MPELSSFRRTATAMSLVAAAALSACGPATTPSGIKDPFEGGNRSRHEFNTGVDRYLFRPASQVYGNVLPQPVRTGVSNFAGNLGLPGEVVNGTLQGRPRTAIQNTLRFVVNSTIGIFGLFDPATPLGLPEIETDFGETLHVWGVGEGNYMELPFLGPSTDRDFTGTVVDVFLNPLGFLNLDNQYLNEARIVSKGGDVVGKRYTYSDLVDGVLYDSADSYAQARRIYLDNRRNTLNGGETSEENAYDPYDDLYGQ